MTYQMANSDTLTDCMYCGYIRLSGIDLHGEVKGSNSSLHTSILSYILRVQLALVGLNIDVTHVQDC